MQRRLTGDTPLHLASYAGDVENVKSMLQYGANVNSTNFKNETPLGDAMQEGHYKVAKLLKKHGGIVHWSKEKINENLCKAVKKENLNRLKAYYYGGIDLSQELSWGETLINYAIRHRCSQVLRLIMELDQTKLNQITSNPEHESLDWMPSKKKFKKRKKSKK